MSSNPLRSKRQSQYGWAVVAVSATGSAVGIAGIGCLGGLAGSENLLLRLGYVVAGVRAARRATSRIGP